MKLTELQVVYLGQVTKAIVSLNSAIDEAIALRAKSHDNTRERNEAGRMVEDLERWLKYAEEYRKFAREHPDKMFSG